MTPRPQGSSNPFGIGQSAEPADDRRQPARARRLSLPLRMDDGSTRTFELPSALDDPARFSAAEFERLTRSYAEALGLLKSSR